MSRSLYLTVFILAIALAYASSQTAGGGSSAPDQEAQGQSGTQPGQSSQSGQPGNSSQQGSKPSTNVPGGATDASGGGVVGSAGTPVGKSQVPETPEMPSASAAISDIDLQSQIQNALSKEPTLSGDTVTVTVSPDSVDMTGRVASVREKQTAMRIVQSYAGNKKVVSHLTVTGRNRNAAPGGSDASGNQNPASSGRPPL